MTATYNPTRLQDLDDVEAPVDGKVPVWDGGADHLEWPDTFSGTLISAGTITSSQIADGTVQVGDLAFDPTTQAELNTAISAEVSDRNAAIISAVASHEADTTNIHGIADTSTLVLTSDSRLSNARTPTTHAATHLGGSDSLYGTLDARYFLASASVALAANAGISAAAGTGSLDMSAASGVFRTTTGAVLLGGDVTVAPGKTVTAGAVANQPSTNVAAQTIRPYTSGLFIDFARGAPGVAVNTTDDPSSYRLDTIQFTDSTLATNSIVYANDAVLAPIPYMAKVVTSASATAYMGWEAATYRTSTDHYGRLYLYMDGNPAANIRLLQWSSTGTPCGYVRLDTARKFEILDGSLATIATSTTVLATLTHYRIEWHMIHGATGTLELRIYAGHSTTPLETLTSPAFNNQTKATSFYFGSINNSNLAGVAIRVGAVAERCTNWPGPYTGTGEGVWRFQTPSGTLTPLEVDANGEIVMRARSDFTYGLGSVHYRVQTGDEVLRLDGHGNMRFGRSPWLGNSMGNPQAGVPDAFVDGHNQGVYAERGIYVGVNEPPDLAFTRFCTSNNEFSGTDAATVSGSSTVSIPSMTFAMIDRGKGISVGGTSYNIQEILGPNSIQVDPVPVATASGLTWFIETFPYPHKLHGVTSGTEGGQLRVNPAFFPFVRAGSGAVVASGSSTITVSGFTSADIGRYILLNNDTTQIFQVTNVAGTTVTLSANAGITGTVAWALSAGATEGGAIVVGFSAGTIGFKMAGDARQWDAAATKLTAPVNLVFSLANASLHTAGSGTTDVLTLQYDGTILPSDGGNFVFGTTTGTKFGTATSQKIGFFNATPVVRPSGNIVTALSNLGLVSGGTIAESDVTGLVSDLALKSPLASPTFTGTVTLPVVTIGDASDIAVGTTTGTKIGTSTSQKLGFFNSTPIVKPSGNVITALANLGLVSSGSIAESDVTSLVSDLALKAPLASPTFTGTVTTAAVSVGDASNIALGSTTGTKIGTATTQKIGFFNATPVVQPSSTTDLRTALINLGLYASGGATPLNLNGGALTVDTLTVSNTTSSFWGARVVIGSVGGNAGFTIGLDASAISISRTAANQLSFSNIGSGVLFNGDVKIATVGNGLYIKEGTNATMGTATLVLGTATVSTTKVTANSRIFLSIESLGTVALPKTVGVTARTAGTSFTITSSDVTDTSVVAWIILEPA